MTLKAQHLRQFLYVPNQSGSDENKTQCSFKKWADEDNLKALPLVIFIKNSTTLGNFCCIVPNQNGLDENETGNALWNTS